MVFSRVASRTSKQSRAADATSLTFYPPGAKRPDLMQLAERDQDIVRGSGSGSSGGPVFPRASSVRLMALR